MYSTESMAAKQRVREAFAQRTGSIAAGFSAMELLTAIVLPAASNAGLST